MVLILVHHKKPLEPLKYGCVPKEVLCMGTIGDNTSDPYPNLYENRSKVDQFLKRIVTGYAKGRSRMAARRRQKGFATCFERWAGNHLL